MKESKLLRFAPAAGAGLFVGMMATGYYYNVTFVQLGLLDLGTRHLGISPGRVTMLMALFALVTCVASLLAAAVMPRLGWSTAMLPKLRVAALVAAAQAALTFGSAWVRSEAAFTAWLVVAALLMGLGIPATFGLTVDLVPVRHRGAVAGLITAIAYFAAPVFSHPWAFEHLRSQLLPILAGGAGAVSLLAFAPNPLMLHLSRQAADPDFGIGRYTAERRGRGSMGVLILIAVLMFGVFFIDSLGFLRLSEEPLYMQGAWHAEDPSIRIFIGLVHVLGAWIAGVFYTAFDYRALFAWTFGLFALVHLLYTFPVRIGDPAPVLVQPMIYALAVSVYTVLNFALWGDLSTPGTITRNAAIGVGVSGWTATFISTGLALAWNERGMALAAHLRYVDALAVVLFLGVLVALYIRPGSHKAAPRRAL